MQSTNPAGSGGFLKSLPSPSPSTTSSHRSTPNLPHPRSHPLHAGSKKEDTARRYVENRLLQISRRFVKKFSVLPGEEDTEKADVRGYANFNEVAKDLDEVVDVLWLSGTRKFLSLKREMLKLMSDSVASDTVYASDCGDFDFIPTFISASAIFDILASQEIRSCFCESHHWER